ncbi:hypothetical protein [uncultured Reyranella sp.]|uniref:hypothetical protein n=1 Tax=uncultured Reyranella sp. TaxID=735512 RepID=UPI0025D0DFCB|nr:hypothetical protein [uncultured Reyranella sp.]
MSIIALRRRMLRMDRGRESSRQYIEQMSDAELEAAIEVEVRKTDPALADRLRRASVEERAQLHKQMAAGELP